MSAYGRGAMGGGQPIAPPPGGYQSNSILGALKATEILERKAVLPAEILVSILDYLPIPDLMRCARTCHRLREMVYDDTRWVARLQSMGAWNEMEARRRFEEGVVRRRRELAAAAAPPPAGPVGGGSGGMGPGGGAPGGKRTASGSTTLFDASLEEERKRQLRQQQIQQQQQQEQQLAKVQDGFETLTVGGGANASAAPAAKNPVDDPDALLNVFKNVRSIRGHAREEYAKIYGALAPFYWDLVRAKTHADPVVFKVFRDPERQAQMLANLRVFARSDWAQGWQQREEKMANMTNIFEGAVLREFEQGYEFWDVDGRMNKYAHVLDVLNSSTAAIELFIQKHPIFSDRDVAATNAMDCLRLAPANQAASAWNSEPTPPGHAEEVITLEPSHKFFEQLTRKVNEQGAIIERIFPRPAAVFWQFVDKVREDIIMEYITPLLDETHERSVPAYLNAMSGLFEQCLQFLKELEPPKGAEAIKKEEEKKKAAEAAAAAGAGKNGAHSHVSAALQAKLGKAPKEDEDAKNEDDDDDDDANAYTPRARLRKAREIAYKTFEPHMDLYLQEELDFFTKHAEAEVSDWEKKLSEQDASVESFYMANFNRREVKNDFLSSFKKVVMMPVMLPGQLLGNPFGTSSSTSGTKATEGGGTPTNGSSLSLPQPQPPQQSYITASGRATPNLPDKAPDDELAAKAALMASRLEGIKSLFSIEMALNLVHAAKSGLSRAAVFMQLGGQAAGEAKEQCETIFVVLLRVLGNGHLKVGFDRAIKHLSQYNPREVSTHRATADDNEAGAAAGASGNSSDGGVAPLMTFIELVNVGDLISQMIDVFYEQQLAGPKIVDRNDFLDAAGIAKKRFEQMIDENVAAGLNKGIDVLMDEVEYICATTQKPTDYYPEAGEAAASDSGLFFLNGVTGSGSTGGTSTPTSGGAGTMASPGLSRNDSSNSAGGGGGGGPNNGSTAAFGMVEDLGPTKTAVRVVSLVRDHTNMLKGSTEKTMLDVFNGEVGLRLFTAVCKHLKRQRISMGGAVHVIADMTLYFDYIRTLCNQDLLAYFRALRELSQLYLIDAKHHAKEMAVIIADSDRFGGVFRAEEVYEFAERRADWYQVKRNVERAMYGLECSLM